MPALSLLQAAFGAVVVDVALVLLNSVGVLFVSEQLRRLYGELGVVGMLTDGIAIALLVYAAAVLVDAERPVLMVSVALGLQVTYDVLLYLTFRATPRGEHYLFDLYKDYAAELGRGAFALDSLLVAAGAAVGLGLRSARLTAEHEAALLLAAVYAGVLVLYRRRPTTA